MAKNLTSLTNPMLLEAALEGLLAQKKRLDEQIDEIRNALGRGNGRKQTAVRAEASAPPVASKRRKMSAAARKRIAEAQKKRWAAFHKTETK